jgi:predicted RNase H-like HicB family nuclease
MAELKTKLQAEAGQTKAIQLEDQHGDQAVAIWDLDVLIVPDGKFWFAQGLQLDYCAQGDSIEDAKKNFEDGLEATIDLNLRMYDSIENLLICAPSEVLKEALRNKESIRVYKQISIHEIGTRWQSALPFDVIRFLVSKEAA